MGNKNYVVYHLHTEDSLLDSCTNYKLYVDKAVELGQKAIAFSEHGNIYNWIEKKMYCDEHNIKYIHGIECYLTETLDEKIRDNYHTVLLAKNYDGVKEINNLIELSTRVDHYYYKPRITFDEFFALSDNVIKISACLASPLNKLRDRVNEPIYNRLCKKYDYFEIQPHINSDEQKDYNKHLLKLSKKYNTPLIMGTDTHSLNTYKAECRSILQLSKRIEFSNEDTFDLTYKSYDELVEMCKEQNCFPIEVYLTAIEDTNVMADSIENWELDKKVKYPKSYDNEEYVLKQRIFEMYKDKVRRGVITNDKRYIDNIKEELRVFKKINMIGFMLFMSELMCWCKENGIPTSPCRGSVGGSTVAYITDIIDVDPVKWNTVFSRFANEDRVEVGDIDVDIAPDQRKLVYQHIIDKFGTDKTAYILAMGTISDKGTIDDIGRALGIKWSREHNDGENPYSLANVAKIKEEYDINAEVTKEKYPELFYYFDGLLGTVVSQSMHPAGIVVSPITLPDNYGVFWGENKEKEKVLILSVNMEEVHECGLVKYDILGLKNIQILRECCKFAGIKYPAAHETNWEDEEVWKHITDSPVGIFQFESPFAYELLKQYQPRKINDLSLVNASLRPSGTSYRDRLIAREKNKNPSKQIDDLLKENNGFLCIEENQKVSTLNGLKAIKDVSVGDLVYTTRYTTSGLEKVNKVFNNGIKDVYELKTKYGSVVCTKDHKVLTENGWKEYQNIELGECICHYVGTKSTKEYDMNKLRLIGWTLGDGITSRNNIGFINQNYNVVLSYKNTIEKIWNNLSVSIKDVKTRVNNLPLYRCNVKWLDKPHKYDKPIHYYFDEIGIRKKTAKEKFVPEFIFDLNKNCLLAFLGAYTDTDSSIRNNTIMYKTSSKKLCDGIVEILRLIGYSSSICYDKKTDSYNICVLGGNELIYELRPYCIKIRDNIKDEKNVIRKHKNGSISINVIKKWLQQNNISISKVQKTIGVSLHYIKYINIFTIEKICNTFNIIPPVLISDNIHYLPVTSKSYIGKKRVYDLEINNTHNFVAGGIVVHNCFQEDTIKFLQDICGLSGSESDNIRRAIGRKKKDILEKAMPKILDGYCEKSDKPRNIAEQEAKTFLQIIEDSASYQFGYNHSTGYSMVGYLCAYMRYYYPLEFITAYLNCAGSNLKDIESGTELAKQFGIEIRLPKFRHSKGSYWFDKKENCLYKGIGSIKDLNVECGEYLYSLKDKHYKSIIALMSDLPKKIVSSKKLDILIKIGFFDEFGTINNLLEQIKIYNQYNSKKQITKNKLTDEEIKLISTCCEKETDKMFKGIDNVKLMNAIYKSKKIPKTTDLTKAHYQLKLIGSTNVIIPDSEYYGIESTETNSYGTPFITLYDFQNGKTKQFKCNKKWYKDYPCEQGDIVEVGFTQKKKVRFIGTDENGKNIYQPTGEYEDIIKMYAIQNMEI